MGVPNGVCVCAGVCGNSPLHRGAWRLKNRIDSGFVRKYHTLYQEDSGEESESPPLLGTTSPSPNGAPRMEEIFEKEH